MSTWRSLAPVGAGLLVAAGLLTASLAAAAPAQTRQSTWTDAYSAYSRGDFLRAESLFRDLVDDYPEWGYARYMLALTLQRLGRSDDALGELARGERRATDPESRLLTQRALAEIRLQRGEYQEAIRAAEEAERVLADLERQSPVQDFETRGPFGSVREQRVAIVDLLSRGYMRQQRWSEAARHLERLTELRPANAAAFAMLGRARYQLDTPSRALEAFDRTLELDPANAEALRYSSRIHLEQGRHQQAFEVARRGIQARPGDAELLEILGEASLETGRYREAVEALQAAAQQRPLGGRLRCRLGDAYLQLDEPGRAAEQYRAATDLLGPDGALLPGCLRGLATAYEATGRLEQALEAYQELLEIERTAAVVSAIARLRRAIGGEGSAAAGAVPDPDAPALRTFDGTGTRSTRPFEVGDGWEIQWTSSQGIRIVLFSASGEQIGVAAEQESGGSGSTFQPGGGDYFLRIEAVGDWEIRIVDIPASGR